MLRRSLLHNAILPEDNPNLFQKPYIWNLLSLITSLVYQPLEPWYWWTYKGISVSQRGFNYWWTETPYAGVSRAMALLIFPTTTTRTFFISTYFARCVYLYPVRFLAFYASTSHGMFFMPVGPWCHNFCPEHLKPMQPALLSKLWFFITLSHTIVRKFVFINRRLYCQDR